jgi:hypothetical protein
LSDGLDFIDGFSTPPVTILTPSSINAVFDEDEEEDVEAMSSAAVLKVRLTAPAR